MPEESVRSETDLTSTVTFNNLGNLLLRTPFVHLCALPQTFGPYHKYPNNETETSALTELKKSLCDFLG